MSAITVKYREHIAKELIDFFKQESDVLCVYLFGSTTTARDTRFSDVDLAVLFDKGVDPNTYTDRSIDLSVAASKLLSREVDVVVLNRASTNLKFQIIKNGIRIYDRRKRNDRRFEGRAIIEYFDYLPIKRRMEDRLIKKIRERANG